MANPALILLQGDPDTWANPPAGKTAIGVNAAGEVVTKQSDGTEKILVASNPTIAKATVDGGSTTITPTSPFHTQADTVTGAARVITVILDETVSGDGAQLRALFLLPATAGMRLQIFSGVTKVSDFTNDDGSVRAACFEYYFDVDHWAPLRETVPSFTP